LVNWVETAGIKNYLFYPFGSVWYDEKKVERKKIMEIDE
jgi:hypothetical protein